MLNHVRSWLFVDRLSRPVVVLDRLPGLYGLKYDSATACGLPLYLCSYKLDSSITTVNGVVWCLVLGFSDVRVAELWSKYLFCIVWP